MNMSREIKLNGRKMRDIATNDISTLGKGKSFEKKVSEIFTLMGFKVDRNRTWKTAGNEIDIFLEKKKSIGRKNEYYICECKNWTKPVGIEVIIRFNYVRECVKKELEKESLARDCDAIIVSPTEFTLRAKEAANVLGISLFTYDQLLAEVMDFDKYLTLLMQVYAPNKKEYIEQNFWSESKAEILNSFKMVEQWLENPGSKRLLILGDLGIGKSSFVRQLASKMAENYKENPQNAKIPYYIDINQPEYKQLTSFSELLQSHLGKNMVEPANTRLFLKLLSERKILLIIDSFDQMGNTINIQTASSFISQLNKELKGDAKVIITARNHSFRNNCEVSSIFKIMQFKKLYSRYKPDSENSEFDIVYLMKFSDQQIEEYLKKVLNEKWYTVQPKIQFIYEFSDIASRPMLLNSIVNNLMKYEGVRGPVDMHGVCIYDLLERERYILPEIIVQYLEELAYTFWQKGRENIHHTELFNFISEKLKTNGVYDDSEIHIADYQIRSATFLVRDNDGNYSFAHKSFREFFIAQKIIDELDMHNFTILDLEVLSEGTIYFLRHMKDEAHTLRLVKEILSERKKHSEKLLINALYIFCSILRKSFLGQDFLSNMNAAFSSEDEEKFWKEVNALLPEDVSIQGASLKEWNIISKIQWRNQ